MSSTHLFAVALLPAIACSGCGSATSGARKQFSEQYFCPADRVTVTERHYPAGDASPPPGVAEDPERFTVWREQENKRRLAEEEHVYYVASGCGQVRVYSCACCNDDAAGSFSCVEETPRPRLLAPQQDGGK